MSTAVLSTVRDDLEAEELCGLLRVNGIPCTYHKSTLAYPLGMGAGAAVSSMGGPTDVLVSEHDLERAQELLASPAVLREQEPNVD